MKREINFRKLDEKLISNADETYFIFNLEREKIVRMSGRQSLNYADVVFNDDPMTVIVRTTIGNDAYIQHPISHFQK